MKAGKWMVAARRGAADEGRAAARPKPLRYAAGSGLALRHSLFTMPVLALVLLSFVLGTSEFVVIGILPDIASSLAVSLALAGALVTVFAFAFAVGTPVVAALTSRCSRFRVLIALMGVFVLGNFISAAAPNYTLLAASRLLVAVVAGTLVSVAMTFSGDVAAPELQPKVIAAVFSGYSIAAVAGVPIGTAICGLWGWRASFLAVAAASAAVWLLLYLCLPRCGAARQTRLGRQFALFREPRILLGMLTVFFSSAGTYVFYTYMTPVLEEALRVPPRLLGAALLAVGVGTVISNLLSGRIAAAGGMRALPAAFLAQAACLALLPLTFAYPPLGLADVFAISVLMYLLNASTQVHFLKIAQRRVPEAVNLASSLSPVSFNLGIACGAGCGSLIVHFLDLRYIGLCGAALALGAFAANVCLNYGRLPRSLHRLRRLRALNAAEK